MKPVEHRYPNRLRLLSDRVLENSSLVDLRVREIDAKLMVPSAKPPFEPQNLRVEPVAGQAEDFAVYDYIYNLSAADGRKNEVATFRLALSLVFKVKRQEKLTPAELDAFGRIAGIEIAHPYLRELVHNLTLRMGLPALVLDVNAPTFDESDKQIA
jgi:hypothetical protein